MSVSDGQFIAWLKQYRDTYTVLCEIDYVEEVTEAPQPRTLRIATLAYTDHDNGYQFKDWVHDLPSYSRQLQGDNLNNYASTIGALVLNNADGRCDAFADAIVDGYDARFYVGDVSWQKADFRLIFVATVSKISVPSQDRLSVELRDTGLLLNKTIGGEFKVGGEGPNADEFRPVNIGYVAQAKAILFDEDTQTFVYNDTGDGLWPGAAEQVVRDNGYPVGYTDNGDGKLTLDDAPIGAITTNVMATPAGDEANRLTSDVIDEIVGQRAGLSALGLYDGAQDTFEVAGDEDWPLGINITERRNIVDVLAEVCDSGTCGWAISRLNHFFYFRLRPSYIDVLGVSPAATIRGGFNDYGDHVLTGISRDPFDPKYHKLQIYVSKNWEIPSTTVSTDSSGDPRILTSDELAIVTRPGLSVIQGDSVGSSYANAPERYHKTLSESSVIETLVSDPDDNEATTVADAWMEVTRANQLPWLHSIPVTVPLQFYELELGNVVTLKYPRFGYDAGVKAQVIGVDISLSKRTVGLRLYRRHLQEPYAGRDTTPIDDAPETVRAFAGRPKVTVTGGGDGGTGGFGGGSAAGGVLPFYYNQEAGVVIGGSYVRRRGASAPPPDGYIVWRPINNRSNPDGDVEAKAYVSSGSFIHLALEWRPTPLDMIDGSATPIPAVTVSTDHDESVTQVSAFDNVYFPALCLPAHHSEYPLALTHIPNGNTFVNNTALTGAGFAFHPHDDGSGNYASSAFGAGAGSLGLIFWSMRVQNVDWIAYMFYVDANTNGGQFHFGFVQGTDLPSTLGGLSVPTLQEPEDVGLPFDSGKWSASFYRYSPRPFNRAHINT